MKRKLSNVLRTIVASCVIANPLKATIYYVSPTGNDAAAGTSPATAWKTIAKVNGMAILPGNSILFQGGQTFSGSIYLDANDANDTSKVVLISSYGTGRATISSGNAYGFYAYNTKGFTVSNLIFAGSGVTTNTANGVAIFTDLTGDVKLAKIAFKNLDIHDYGVVGLSISSSYNNSGFKNVLIDSLKVYQIRENGITSRGTTSQTHVGYAHSNISIKHTEVYNVTGYSDPSNHRGSGIILAQADQSLIENTCAHHNGSGNTHCGGPGGIWAWDCNNLTIQFCESHHNSHGSGGGCDGLGFDLDGGMTNSLMQYNYSHDNDGAGYLLGQFDNARPWANNVMRYNISQNDGRTNSGGITLFKGAGTTMNGVKIYQNTIYTSPSPSNSGVGAFTIIDWNTGITGVEVYNNIFQSTGGAYLVDIPAGYNAFFAGNLYWSSGGTFKIVYQGTTYSSVAAWRSATSNELVGGVQTGVTANPLLTNAGTAGTIYPAPTSQLNAYKLPTGSPAINAGQNLLTKFSINAGTRDYFNNAAPTGPAPDIGAFESTPVIPLNITDTAAPKITVYKSNSDQMAFFPNPVDFGEPLKLNVANPPYTVKVISILTGSLVRMEEKFNSESANLSTTNLARGIYVVSITDNIGQQLQAKLIIR